MNSNRNQPTDATVARPTMSALQEHTLNARLIHPYLDALFRPYGEWITGVKLMCSRSDPHAVEHGGVISKNGEDAITANLAFCMALTGTSLAEAAVLIVIDESFNDPTADSEAAAHSELRRYLGLLGSGNQASPRTLHQFLGVEEDYALWIARYIKELRMKLGRNYLLKSATRGRGQAKEVILSFRMAQEIALQEKTIRARKVQRCMEFYQQRCHGNNWKRLDDLMVALRNPAAEAGQSDALAAPTHSQKAPRP